REEVVKDASVFARVLKILVFGELDGGGGDGEERGSEFTMGEIGAELSDWKDCDLGPMGIVKFFSDFSLLLLLSDGVLLVSRYSSSGGTSSAGGIVIPLAAAMS